MGPGGFCWVGKNGNGEQELCVSKCSQVLVGPVRIGAPVMGIKSTLGQKPGCEEPHGLCPAKSWIDASLVLRSVFWGSVLPKQTQTGRWRFLNPLERKMLWCQCSQDPCSPAPEVTLSPGSCWDGGLSHKDTCVPPLASG